MGHRAVPRLLSASKASCRLPETVDACLLGQHEMLDDVGNRPFVSTRFEALLLDAQGCNRQQHMLASHPYLGDQGEHLILYGESGIDSLFPVYHPQLPPSLNKPIKDDG